MLHTLYYTVTNLGPPAHLSIFLPNREHLSECTELPCVSLAEIYGRFDGIALLVRLTVSHLSPPWTRRHHSTNSDLIHAKLLCIHTGEHHHRDSEEPSSHITPCILHVAYKRHLWTSQVFHFLKTHQLAKLLASLIWLQLGQKVLTLNLIHSEDYCFITRVFELSFWSVLLL